MIEESMQLHGAMTLIVQRANGEVETVRKDNLIVDVGFDFIANAIGNATRPAAMGWIALGTGTTAAAATQTALVTEIDRNAATYAHTAGTKTFSFTASFLAGDATGAITEAGVFNAATAGTMLDRVVFPVVNKGVDDSLTAVFTFTMS
ncbi:MAG: hypothetical protein MO847_09690 [Candidatus Protistobacter heckmanni]|nr:hypothetical protein [Candidatus Protistobacter heckmanni]